MIDLQRHQIKNGKSFRMSDGEDAMKQIKVLMIGDAAVIKKVASSKLLSSEPNLLTLDVEIPKMDGAK